MLPTHGSAQEIENARVALVLIVTSIVIFWRVLVRVLVAIVVIAVCVGVFVLLQSVHP
jgi:hypothetical protein